MVLTSKIFRLSLLITPLFWIMLALAPEVHAEISGAVTGSIGKGYGRLVFTLDKLPKHSTKLTSTILVLSFEEQVNLEVSGLVSAMSKYLSIARLDPDHRAIRFALTSPHKINTMVAGNKLFIDILPISWRGLPPPLPKSVIAQLAARALEAEKKLRQLEQQKREARDPYKLNIRVAEQPTFSRIVFDWNKFVGVKMSRDGDKVTVKFDHKDEVSLARLKVDPPKYLSGAISYVRQNDMFIELALDAQTDVRGFREKNSYIIDLTGPFNGSSGALEDAVKNLQGQGSGEATTLSGNWRTNVKPAENMVPRGSNEGGRTSPEQRTERLAHAGKELKSVDPGTIDKVDEATETDRDDAAPVVKNAGEEVWQERTQRGAAAFWAMRKNQKKGTLSPKDKARARNKNTKSSKTENLLTDLRVEAQMGGSILRLKFPFPGPVSAAGFRRGQHLWVIFDSTIKHERSVFRTLGRQIVSGVKHFATEGAQIYRLKLASSWLVSMTPHEGGWQVLIGENVPGNRQPLNVQREVRTDNDSVVSITLAKAGRIHWIEDPDIGDRIAAITARGPSRGLNRSFNLVDMNLIPSAHGIAIKPLADDLDISLRGDRVVFSKRGGYEYIFSKCR